MTSNDQECDHETGMCRCDVRYDFLQENSYRGNWLCAGQGTLALLGILLTISDVWTFPYLMYINGGAVYLVVYTVMIVLIGVPAMYLAISIGQFTSNGVLTCWPLPIFKGIGAGIIATLSVTVIMYTTIGAWAMTYFYYSADSSVQGTPFPWESRAALRQISPACYNASGWTSDQEVASEPEYDEYSVSNVTYYENYGNSYPDVHRTKRPSEVFYDCHVQVRDRMTDGAFNATTAICLVITWIIIAAVLAFRVKVVGVVMNILVPFVVLMILVFTIRAVSLPGASYGMKYLFYPDWTRLHNVYLWLNALNRTLYSWAVMSGAFITYGSYNRFHNNIVRDVTIVAVIKYALQLLCAVLMFGFYGFLANAKGLEINSVAQSGPAALFMAMAEVFLELPRSGTWSALFYFFIFILILINLLALMEVSFTGLVDQFPVLRKWRPLLVVLCCLVFFLLGLPLCSAYGHDLFQTLDLVSSASVFVLAILFGICLIVYGIMTYFSHRHDVAAMSRYDCCCVPSVVYWSYASFTFIAALILLGLGFIRGMAALPSDMDSTSYLAAWTTRGMAQCIVAFPCVVVILTALIQIIVSAITKRPTVLGLFQISKFWRPESDQHNNLVTRYRTQNKYSSQRYTPVTYQSNEKELDYINDDQKHPPAYESLSQPQYVA